MTSFHDKLKEANLTLEEYFSIDCEFCKFKHEDGFKIMGMETGGWYCGRYGYNSMMDAKLKCKGDEFEKRK